MTFGGKKCIAIYLRRRNHNPILRSWRHAIFSTLSCFFRILPDFSSLPIRCCCIQETVKTTHGVPDARLLWLAAAPEGRKWIASRSPVVHTFGHSSRVFISSSPVQPACDTGSHYSCKRRWNWIRLERIVKTHIFSCVPTSSKDCSILKATAKKSFSFSFL